MPKSSQPLLSWIVAVSIALAPTLARADQPTLARADQPAPCPWPASQDAIAAAPQHHTVLFENEEVRVLEVTVLPKVKQPLHAHCWPSVLYVTSGTTYVDYDAEGKIIFDSRSAPVPQFPVVEWLGPQAPHAVENLGDDPVHLIRVELKRSRGDA